jgi:hypothetical protein
VRTGSEGRISTLKRGYGWDRTAWIAPKEPGAQREHPGMGQGIVVSARRRIPASVAGQYQAATKGR